MENNVWNIVLEHTPPVIRWILAGLGSVVLAMGAVVYKRMRESNMEAHARHSAALESAEQRHKDDMQDVRNRLTAMDAKIDTHLTKTNELLAQISQHTERRFGAPDNREHKYERRR